MPVLLRLACVVLAALLGGCASYAPQIQLQPPTSPQSSWTMVQPAQAEEVLLRAIGLVGTPYRWGGNTPESGFDCSGLIVHVYRGATGLQLPRTTREMSAMRVPHVDRQQLRSGDIVLFATQGEQHVSHAGIYVGGGRFVHAPRTGGAVRLDRLDAGYWQRSYLGGRRVLAEAQLARNQ